MHHFIYPTQDTFITNITGYDDLNFGLNEILRVGAPEVTAKQTILTKEFTISSSVSQMCITNFSGSILNASGYGTGSNFIGIISSSLSNVDTSFFTGIFSGSIISASLTGSSDGQLVGFSGSLSGRIIGSISGSFWTDYIDYFDGTTTDFTGKLYTGYINGKQILDYQHKIVVTKYYSNRALVQFDLSSISESISSGDIQNPRFVLKMKTAREENVPIRYSLLAYPLSQSWEMGNGYWFDGGSLKGASWLYRDYFSGSAWATTGSSYITSLSASQLVDYQQGDISMDITEIANQWISGSIVNNGLVILTTEETNATGSGISLYYFSKDSNTIYSPYIDVGWDDYSIITGSVSTSSVVITNINAGTTSSIQTGSFIITPGGGINGMFSGDSIITKIAGDISGPVIGVGESGTVKDLQIIGNIIGTSSLDSTWLSGSCGKRFNAYFITASFIDGLFSGSTFTGYYTNYRIEDATITGSWLPEALYGSSVVIPIPSGIEPFSYAYISGPYIDGKALGSLTISSSTSSSFDGQIIEGYYVGSEINLQMSGSVYTSAYYYTSSVAFETNELEPMQVSTPFVLVVKLSEKVKTNEIIKVRVYGREQFPLKNFQRLTQFSQFLTPLYLPSSSFYAIKDNETEEIILDFDNYTRLSCDQNGNYFMLDTSGLPQERYFKVLIKVEQSGSTYVVDNNNIFKVVR